MEDSSRRSVPTIRTSEPSEFKVDEELAKKWLANGAQPTEVVGKLFKISRYRKIRLEVAVMKELVEVIAKSLVDNPEEVTVTERQTGKTTVVELKVAPSDMGKVIGKQGRIAKAIRAVVKAAASKEDKKVVVDIL